MLADIMSYFQLLDRLHQVATRVALHVFHLADIFHQMPIPYITPKGFVSPLDSLHIQIYKYHHLYLLPN